MIFEKKQHILGMAYQFKDGSEIGTPINICYPMVIANRSAYVLMKDSDRNFHLEFDEMIRAPENDLIPRKEVDALAKRNAELEAALKFYADPLNWTNEDQVNVDEQFDTPMSWKNDKHGHRAREAIANNAGKDS